MECFYSVQWDLNDKGHGGHVSVPNKRSLIKIILYGGYDVKCKVTLHLGLFCRSLLGLFCSLLSFWVSFVPFCSFGSLLFSTFVFDGFTSV